MTEQQHQPILGLNEPDIYGEMPKHVVALTEDEIDTLWRQHLYAAKQTRPRKRVKQSDRDAQSHVWYSSRAALFERLLPKEEPDDFEPPAMADVRDPESEPHAVVDEHGALVSYGGGPDTDLGPAYLPLRQAGQQ